MAEVKKLDHILICNAGRIFFQHISFKQVTETETVKTLENGLHTRVVGQRPLEITIKGSCTEGELVFYRSFIATYNRDESMITIDGSVYNRTRLKEGSVTIGSDSSIGEFVLKIEVL
ncbi:MAG: hypothetical protein IJ737_07940 [Ruminococcus sp.]|nr:hypothetical protein [Ruminococcus sp.]